MATLSEMRTRVRVWLEDEAASPLWSDAEIDEGLKAELDEYSAWNPDHVRQTYAVAAGNTSISLGVEVLGVYRVVDPNGRIVPRRSASPARYVADEEQSWELWGSTLSLARQVVAGDWTVWYEGYRAFPATDAGTFPVPAGDEALIVAGAVVWCLEHRAREEWKRGPLPPRYEQRLQAAKADYRDLMNQTRRRLRVATVEVTG